jgi:hypothetical protein
MKALLLSAAVVALCAILTGCGTVSHVTPASGATSDLKKYDRVLVLDFADGVSDKGDSAAHQRKRLELALATKSFPDEIAIELQSQGVFREVTRSGQPDAHTLVISGTVTRYAEGDAMGRMFVGLGVGSSYFDATVQLKDGAESSVLATQKVDKNSFVFGGGIAANQTPLGFMRQAAKKLATDLVAAKRTGNLPTTGQVGSLASAR